MSELIEVHQLDYKACSLTYGEGACTAEAGTRPAATGRAVFNGSSSKIEFASAVFSPSLTSAELRCNFVLTGGTTTQKAQIYAEYFAGGTGSLDIWATQTALTVKSNTGFVYQISFNFSNSLVINQEYNLKVVLTPTPGNTGIEVFIDGISLGSQNLGGELSLFLNTGVIGLNNARSFKLYNFKLFSNSVLVRDLPLATDVTDQTGNTTPAATDVTFETVCPDITRDVASFNGSTSEIDISPINFTNTETDYRFDFSFLAYASGNGAAIYEEEGAGSNKLEIRYNPGSAVGLSIITSSGSPISVSYQFAAGEIYDVSIRGTGSHYYDIYINNVFVQNSQLSAPFGSASSSAKIGKGFFSSKLWNFKIYKDGVLVRDLPLATDATDQTGNTTPVATDVSFVSQAVSGVDPDNPTLCALVPDPNKKCFNTYATCQDRPNYSATTKTLTFTKQNSALPKQAGSTVGFFPSITNSSTQSAELNVGARRFDLNTLGKSSSASITMTDAPYSDNLTDPYVLERTYNPLERGTFWGKFLAQNPYYSGDEYRIYTGEAGQNISDMDYKRYLVDKITLPNSAGTVSISCVDQLRTLDFDKAIFLDAGTFTIQGSISQSDVDILTNYPVGTTADLPDTLQPYFKLDDEVIKFGNLGQQNGYYKFESCIRGQFGTTAESHENSTIQLCHYFQKSNVLPTAQAGLYYHLKTLYNDAGWSDSLLDLTGWETEISTRLSLYDDVARLVHEPTPTADLIGELQRDCGFFSWFDEYDKKLKIKAVRPEIESYSIDEYNHILAGTAQFNVESQDRITQLVFSYDMPNKVLSVDNRGSYSQTHITLTDKANPNQYGQSITHVIKSPWLQSLAQVKRTSNRIIQRYDDSTTFCNFMLDRSFSVRMGQVFKMAHSGTQNADGSPRSILWQVIGIDRVQDKIKVKAQQFYLDAGYGVWGDNTIPNYSNSTDEQKEKYAYWGISKWG